MESGYTALFQMGLRQNAGLHGISVQMPEGLWIHPCDNVPTYTSAARNPAWPDRSLAFLGLMAGRFQW